MLLRLDKSTLCDLSQLNWWFSWILWIIIVLLCIGCKNHSYNLNISLSYCQLRNIFGNSTAGWTRVVLDWCYGHTQNYSKLVVTQFLVTDSKLHCLGIFSTAYFPNKKMWSEKATALIVIFILPKYCHSCRRRSWVQFGSLVKALNSMWRVLVRPETMLRFWSMTM